MCSTGILWNRARTTAHSGGADPTIQCCARVDGALHGRSERMGVLQPGSADGRSAGARVRVSRLLTDITSTSSPLDGGLAAVPRQIISLRHDACPGDLSPRVAATSPRKLCADYAPRPFSRKVRYVAQETPRNHRAALARAAL